MFCKLLGYCKETAGKQPKVSCLVTQVTVGIEAGNALETHPATSSHSEVVVPRSVLVQEG